ncbi:TonB-dependent receptor, partial [bacterium]|nr:TonB-dependent receptor [bacterium]
GAFRRDAGRPGPVGGFESPHAASRLDRYDLHLALFDRGEAVSLDLDARRSDERLRDEAMEVGWDPAGTTDSRSEHLGGRLSWRSDDARMAGSRCSVRLGAEWRRQWFAWRHQELEDPLRTRTTVGAFAGLDLVWPDAGLTFLPSWRWQRLEDDFPPLPPWPGLPEEPLDEPHVHESPSPALGIIWDALPGELRFETHWAGSYRAPTWIELFGHRGGVNGNRELFPERITTRDIAVFWRPSASACLRLAWFATDVDDGILWVRNSQFTSQANNCGRLHASGLEVEFVADGGGFGRGWANLTVQDAEDRGDDPIYAGKALPYLPELEAALGWEIDVGAWTWGLRWLHEADSHRDRYNSEMDRTPARSLYHLSFSHVWRGEHALGGDQTRLTCELLNLTDDDTYDVEGYPLPGRTCRVSLIFH